MPVQDKDLLSVQQARSLAARAKEAQRTLATFSQEQADRIVEAMANAARADAERLAKMAHEETGFGSVADKTLKNRFASTDVLESIRNMRTVGILREDKARRIVEIAEPMGVVCAVIPSTNPTATTIYKALIAIKGLNAIVMTPHPSARRCILETAAVLQRAGVAAGMPADALLCMDEVSLEGTQELMRTRDTRVILATGGIGLVRAAYSSGKPAYGVGPGNVPAYIEKTADVPKAVRDIFAGKTFDNGTLCSSEQSIVCDEAICEQVVAECTKNGGYFLSESEAAAVAKVAVTPQRLANPEVVGRSAEFIAEKAGIRVPAGTRVLLARLTGVGRDYPLSIEKLCPILSFYVVKDWHEGCERCLQLLRYGGTGHTLGIHSNDDAIIREFALKKPVYRIVANTQTAMGATGYTTGLAPSMSLGCGAHAGNITSDNITPMHLINLKRLAYELPKEAKAAAMGAPPPAAATTPAPAAPPAASVTPPPSTAPEAPVDLVDFVAEEDVRRALRAGKKIHLTPRAIVTPAAHDLAANTNVLVRSE